MILKGSFNKPKSKRAEGGASKPTNLVELPSHARAPHTSNHPIVPAAWQKKTGRCASLVESFYHAFHGIYIAVKQERNVRIHFCAAAVAVVLGVCLKLDRVSWLALALAIGLVITAEFLNTALEHLVDLASRGQYHASARYAKDTAAGAVLIASFIAMITGSLIFLPRIAALCQFW